MAKTKIVVPSAENIRAVADASPRAYQQSLDANVYEHLETIAQNEVNKYVTTRNKKVSAALGREIFFLQKFDEICEARFKGTFKPSAYALKKSHKETKRYINTLWSDLHIGSDLDPREVPLKFGAVEEARRMASIAVQVAEYKTQYRDVTDLNIFLLGDIIEGKLHDILAAASRAEQVTRAIHVLSQAIAFTAQHFKKVTVWCNPGNHERNKERHPERAMGGKWDSDATIIYAALKIALKTLTNVEFKIPRTPYIEVPVFDKWMFGTHGDTMLNVGYPGTTINVRKANVETAKINATNARGKGYEFDLFFVGHVHIASTVELDAGGTFMTNGCLVPPSPFEVNKNSLHHTTKQWIWESVKDFVLGDMRKADVGLKQDKDASLDKIVEPWIDF